MDKNAIKNYAIFARRKLLQATKDKCATFGIYPNGKIDEPVLKGTGYEIYKSSTGAEVTLRGKDIDARRTLVNRIKADGFDATVEEVAYTWFNRLIAIRFMEVNNYLPTRVRVLSSDTPGRAESDLMNTPFDVDLNYTDKERELIANYKSANNTDELFKVLFLRQCKDLSEILPGLFENLEDYKELLFNIRFNDKDDVVYKLVIEIPEEDFDISVSGQIEVIGWMYQYYISEKHDKVVSINGSAIAKEDIPAATQLFTTDWVVKYMVDNSLGKYWIERNPDTEVINNLEFYVKARDGKINFINDHISPEELTFIDPCMGSGHILVYAFDVLMQIYESQGYTQKDAASLILKNNIYGLDIDERAYQLSYFALMMKARQYSRRIFNEHIELNVMDIKESNGINYNTLDKFKELKPLATKLVDLFKDAKEYGSILIVGFTSQQLDQLENRLEEIYSSIGDGGLFDTQDTEDLYILMKPLIKQARILTKKYKAVTTNPPYMNKFSNNLKNYINSKYADYKSDLFSVFMYRNFNMAKEGGYLGFMTPMVWMFIKSYEPLREYIIKNKNISTLIQFEYSAYEEATVPICSFVLKNKKDGSLGKYFRLSDFKGGMDIQKQKVLEAIANLRSKYYFETETTKFSKIPGSPIGYWLSDSFINMFADNSLIGDFADCNNGFTTGDNNLFLRLWFETDISYIAFNALSNEDSIRSGKKWFPYNKGGSFRKWYGNNDYVINWEKGGKDIKEYGHLVPRSMKYQFKRAISWSKISSGVCSFRVKDTGTMFDVAGLSMFPFDDDNYYYLLASANSIVSQKCLEVLSPTLNYEAGHVASLPSKIFAKENVKELSKTNVELSKMEWDSFEISWDFEGHPLLKNKVDTIEKAYALWEIECNDRFNILKSNEEELNRIFIDIYGLNDELTPEVEDRDVTVRKADLTRDIKSLISYAVGCMFGRYSLDTKGLAYAGGEWDSSKYSSFMPDKDNIIPIRDEEFFEDDDIVSRFVEFIRVAYGDTTLEENLTFITDALPNSGSSAREVIRNYFVNDFYKDHCQTYQVTGSGKRPIYWLFSSGKQNGFKALIYMHRYDADTVGRVRTDYLHKIQGIYEARINADNYTIDTSSVKSDVAKARKHKEKVEKQLAETRLYDQALAHIANKRISIDLDDGVKVNYAKFQEVEVINDVGKTVKVDLLEKIK